MENSVLVAQAFLKIQSFSYWIMAASLTVIIRATLSILKALAINNGEADEKDTKDDERWRKKGFLKCFMRSFISNAGDIRIDDYWLPAIIGFSELICFPVFMSKDWFATIGAWIVIKTASSWGGWQKTRTAYNRFLLGNILSLLASFSIYSIFLK